MSTRSPQTTQPAVTNAIPPELLQHLVNLNDNEVIVPLRVMREDVYRIKAVKFNDAEIVKVQNLQDYLYDRGFLPDHTFSSLVVYLFNLGFTLHQKIAAEEAKKEAKV